MTLVVTLKQCFTILSQINRSHENKISTAATATSSRIFKKCFLVGKSMETSWIVLEGVDNSYR